MIALKKLPLEANVYAFEVRVKLFPGWLVARRGFPSQLTVVGGITTPKACKSEHG